MDLRELNHLTTMKNGPAMVKLETVSENTFLNARYPARL